MVLKRRNTDKLGKNGIINISPRTDTTDNLKELYGYPIVTEYKYLGVILQNNLKFNKYLESINEKANVITNEVKMLKGRLQLVRYMQLWKILVRSKLDSALSIADLMLATERGNLIGTLNKQTKDALGLKMQTNNGWIQWYMGYTPNNQIDKRSS